jgi:hypothetical protein
MNSRRFLLAVFAFALLLPLAGCHRKQCCGDSSSFAPPPQPCCNNPLPPGVAPSPAP